MTSILLGACVLICPLMMVFMMIGMRRGSPLRKRRLQSERATAHVGDEAAE